MTEDFVALLPRLESNGLDFKKTGYRLGEEEGRFALMKDIVCMANTPRDGESYIITGVKKSTDGSFELFGVDSHPDDADLQGLFVDRVYPAPNFQYEIIQYSGMQFGVFVMPAVRMGPSLAMKDVGALRQWQTYYRRESRNSLATPSDEVVIKAWFTGSATLPRSAFEDSVPGWDALCESTQNFDPSFRFVLVLSPGLHAKPETLKNLALIPWSFVLDFDPRSDIDGVLAAVKTPVRSRRSLHVATSKDSPITNLNASTEWYLPRGLLGRPETLTEGKWVDWKKTNGIGLSTHVKHIATLSSPNPVVIIVIWDEVSLFRYLQSALESCLEAFGETANVLLLADNEHDYQDLIADVGGIALRIPLEQFCRGIEKLVDGIELNSQQCVIPSSSGAPIAITSSEQRWLEEEMEIVGLGAGLTPDRDSEAGKAFLRGSEPTWYDLGLRYDIDRDLGEKLFPSIRRDLDARRANRTNLYHAPGAGGTTLGRRLLWSFHKQVPCVKLNASVPRNSVERLLRVAAISGLPVLVMVDGSSVSSRDMDELYNLLRSQQAPVVMVQILRRFGQQATSNRTFFLPAELSDAEVERFTHVYVRENPTRRATILNLSRAADKRLRSAFYFGLNTFLTDFKGLPAHVSEHLKELNEVQREVVVFIAIAHYYAQKAVPAQAFAESLGIPANRLLQLENILGNAANLLVKLESNKWRTTHELIATEILQQSLWPQSGDKRLWKQHLSRWAKQFAQVCRGSGTVSDDMLELIRRTFFYRDNTDLLGTERAANKQFAQLIEDIPTREGRLEVLKHVTELFQEEAHFWAHLGRFYGLEMKDHKSAGESIDRAIALNAADPTLYHMRGMSYRYQLYELIENGGDLLSVLSLGEKASLCFSQARTLNPEDEHGYISEAQMLIRVMTYAGQSAKEPPIAVLTKISAPIYLRESLQVAEDLLEIVRRNREGEGASPFEADCRARLDLIYGQHDRALQGWDNLLTRQDTYAPPIRRQIVWTLLARKNREWDGLPSKEIDRIILLLEQNMLQEPENEANLRLWIQAVKRGTLPISLSSMVEKVSNWRTRSASLDSNYYLYVLYALQAIDSVPQATNYALRFMEECRNMARFRRGRTKSYEWFGRGVGAKRLVHQSQLGEWNTSKEFWDNITPLERITGIIAKVDSSQAGTIELPSGLTAFFVPARGAFSSRQVNQKVSFYLGFSLDGLRAWDVKES